MDVPQCEVIMRTAWVILILPIVAAPPAAAQDHAHPAGDASTLGSVEFPVSCASDVQPRMNKAVAMLHSFWFDAASVAFSEIAASDPDCGMAHWGLAVTHMGNPMTRAAPTPAALELGQAATARAAALAGSESHREQMYIAAVQAYYAGEGTHLERMRAFEDALDALRRMHADDMEAAIFHARTVIANASPDAGGAETLVATAEQLQPLFARHPDHPGLAHYLIHAYDVPALAQRGVDAAKAYAAIAPDAPHALHMPSHIFTRLGYWDESIETNIRSARAEPDSNAAVHPNDYLVYAYLQQGRDRDAHRVVERAVEAADRFYGGLVGYNSAAMPARYALERSAWQEAAALPVPTGALLYVEAIPRFARALGAARSGRPEAARQEVAALAGLVTRLRNGGEPEWATRTEAQQLAASAWVEHAAGRNEDALRLARRAAELEATVEKHPVTPGPLLPARELEADLLLELGRHAEAQRAYEQTLEREPRRARALYGAARAAELAGDTAAAARHFSELASLLERADAGREDAAAARRFLERR
ncbi:MAG: hypothetical protein WEF86_01275 [Gemmatimonadota bacterium]